MLRGKRAKNGLPIDWLVRALGELGISAEDVCEKMGVAVSVAYSEDYVAPTHAYLKTFEWAAERLEDPALGIRLTSLLKPGDIGVLGYLLQTAATLRDWSELLERYHCVFAADFKISFRHGRTNTECVYAIDLPGGDGFRQDIDFTLACLVSAIRAEVGEDWMPERCSFTYDAPAELTEHQRVFGESLQFSQARNFVEISGDILDTPVSTADARLRSILQGQANQLLERVEQGTNMVAQVQFLILAGLGDEALCTASVARKMNVSERHLRRLLSEHNTSFRELKDSTMLKVAKEALLESDSNVSTIALNLGYSELSAFVRVFKRLVGVSPLQYRKQAASQSYAH